ncbi:MAG: hypothetical protein GWP19_00375 [Planctomycetia bacterium]|nr:hypothetical protein [Planctomycetia bacterium]
MFRNTDVWRGILEGFNKDGRERKQVFSELKFLKLLHIMEYNREMTKYEIEINKEAERKSKVKR